MIQFKKLTAGLLFSAILTLGLTGCGNPEVKKQESTPESVSTNTSAELAELKIGVIGQDGDFNASLGNLAYDQQYFEEELNKVGYTFSFCTFSQGGSEINEALASGAIDGAFYGDFPSFISKSNGIDIRTIAALDSGVQYGILVINDQIKEPKDLEGKKVIVTQGTAIQYFWEKYAVANDIDLSKVEIVNAADPTPLLTNNEVDACVSVSTTLAYFASLGMGNLLDSGVEIPDGYGTTVAVIRNAVLNDHPEVAVAINQALIRAYEDAKENPSLFYAAEETSLISAEIYETDHQFDPELLTLNPQIFSDHFDYYNALNAWLLDQHIITESVDVTSYIDGSFYEKAADIHAE